MRPQQNRRMRGRGSNNNNNRKSPNPLTRSYESNGPDVKIRGSAQQIAEKYTTLARDAQSSGDRVMAENYLQHAEHYNRIIMAAQAQMPVQQVRDNRDEDQDDAEDANNLNRSGGGDQRQPEQRVNGSGPQPVIDGTPAEVALKQGNQDNQGNGQARGEHVNGREQSEEASAEAAPRRQRRPRRPRSRDDNNADANSSDDAPATEAAQ